VAIEPDEIKKIITSVAGTRLLTCLSLIQPITSNELKNFPRLCFEIFKPNQSLNNSKRSFLNYVSNENHRVYPEFPQIFTNTDLYKRILKQSIDAGLVINIPETENKSRFNYYFLNSDICFTINKKGLHINEDTSISFEKYQYNVIINKTKWKLYQEDVKDYIALSSRQWISERELDHYQGLQINSIPRLLNMFHLAIKDPSFLEELQDVFCKSIYSNYVKKNAFPSWNPKTRYKIYSAIKNGLLYENPLNNRSVSVTLQYWGFGDNEFRFCRSYNPLRCLSNFDIDDKDMRKRTPIQCLREVTSDKYKISPEQRPFVFTSLLFNIKNIDFNQLENCLPIKEEKARRFYEIAIVKRNTRLMGDAIFNNNSPFLKMIMKKMGGKAKILNLKKYLSEEIVGY